MPTRTARRYTLVFHSYIGYGGYVVDFKRVKANDAQLERMKNLIDLHFVIDGWPRITFSDDVTWFDGATSRVNTTHVIKK